jgi:hypothetical protein
MRWSCGTSIIVSQLVAPYSIVVVSSYLLYRGAD